MAEFGFTEEPKWETGYRRVERTRRSRALYSFVTGVVRNDERQDFLEEYNCKPPPLFIISVSLLEIIVFIVYAVELKDTDNPVTWTSGLPLYSPFIYRPSKRHEAWRFITYMVVHHGYIHLINNLVCQLALGLPFEMAHKWWRLLILYMVGVLTGSLCHSLVDYNVNLVGASGATFALLGAHLSSVVMNWKELNYKSCGGSFIRVLFSGWLRLILVLALSGLSFGSAIYDRYSSDTKHGKVGISAHAGGLVAGLFLGLSVVKNRHVLPWETIVGWAFLILFIIILVGAILFNIFYKGFPPLEY